MNFKTRVCNLYRIIADGAVVPHDGKKYFEHGKKKIDDIDYAYSVKDEPTTSGHAGVSVEFKNPGGHHFSQHYFLKDGKLTDDSSGSMRGMPIMPKHNEKLKKLSDDPC